MKKILHTEASLGWGGQERRILAEALGLRQRGYEIFFAVASGAKLAQYAKDQGFVVYEIPLKIKLGFLSLYHLVRILWRHHIEIIITHSSSDAWLGGLAGKILGIPVIRTRHLSAPIRAGLNAKLLYKTLAQATVTTCESVAHRIRFKAGLKAEKCLSIPTGIDTEKASCSPEETAAFKKKYEIDDHHFVIGTVCILRSWKGIMDFLEGAKILSSHPHLKWVIVGSGPSEPFFKERWHALKLEEKVIFTGHLENPYPAISCFDLFALLSTAHEGVSQASIQAAYFSKPLITTPVGGLPEVCLDGETGILVPKNHPQNFADAVEKLANNPTLRNLMGINAHRLVVEKFTLKRTLDEMEKMIARVLSK